MFSIDYQKLVLFQSYKITKKHILDAATLISPTMDNYLGNALGLTGSGIFITIIILAIQGTARLFSHTFQ